MRTVREFRTRKPRESKAGFTRLDQAITIMANLIMVGVPKKDLYRETNKQITICKDSFERGYGLAKALADEEIAEKRKKAQLESTSLGRKEKEHQTYKGRPRKFFTFSLDNYFVDSKVTK